MASMSHSCLPNTRMLNSPGYKMVFRTSNIVKAGEELTICYSQVILDSIVVPNNFDGSI